MAYLCLNRAAVAAAATAVVLAALLGGHQPAEASIVTHLFGAAADYSTLGQGMLDVYSWQSDEMHLPLPVEIMEKHHSMRTAKEPTRWPDLFHAKLHLKIPMTDAPPPVVHSFYDYPGDRMMNIVIPHLPQGLVPKLIKDRERRPEHYGLSMTRTIRAFQQQDDKNGVVDSLDGNLFFPDTALWMLFKPGTITVFSRSVPFCSSRSAPKQIVPPPDAMTGAQYLGQQQVDGVNCDVYAKGAGPAPFSHKPFVTLYENAETGTPVKFVMFDSVEIMVQEFEPNKTLDGDGWETPEYCEKAPTPGFPLPVEQ